jgi:hypothetical protein
MLAHLTQRVINLLISLGVVLVHFFNNKKFSSKTTPECFSKLITLCHTLIKMLKRGEIWLCMHLLHHHPPFYILFIATAAMLDDFA